MHISGALLQTIERVLYSLFIVMAVGIFLLGFITIVFTDTVIERFALISGGEGSDIQLPQIKQKDDLIKKPLTLSLDITWNSPPNSLLPFSRVQDPRIQWEPSLLSTSLVPPQQRGSELHLKLPSRGLGNTLTSVPWLHSTPSPSAGYP
ncbi:MAG: hypothetical protein SVY53_03150 [Chloroflexota bacterium]|nr:hypothetical protein [Chloroflexota bacterium]